MKALSTNERLVAFAAQLHARASVAELSKKTRLRSHSVRYALQGLLERRILRPYSFIDSEALGFSAYNFLCALSSHRSEVRERFESTLCNHLNVSGAYRIGGDFHYRVVLLARSTRELLDIMDTIVGDFGEFVIERSFVVRCGAWIFSRRYLNPSGRPSTPLYVGPSEVAKKVDETDVKILRVIGEEGDWQIATLAKKLQLPPSTVEYRLRRLQKDEIVKAWVYAVDAGAFGMLDYRLIVTMKYIDENTRNAFFSFCSKHPNIYSFMRCIGSWDFEIGMEVENRQQVVDIVQSLHESFSSAVRSIRSIPIFDCLKMSMFPYDKSSRTN